MTSRLFSKCLAALAAGGFAVAATATNITPYYLTDGDSPRAWEILNGQVVNTFQTNRQDYPLAVRDTIWIGHFGDAGGTEYDLNGNPTGNTSAGGNNFIQLLDGAGGAQGRNYGVECCGPTNSVTVANGDWSGQAVLFDLGFSGDGIAYDLSDDTLFVSELGNGRVSHFDLAGNLLGQFDLGGFVVGLAYEQVTDTLWGFDRSTNNLLQFDKAGNLLADVDIPNFNPGNPFGGEMVIRQQIPEPGTLVLTLLGLAAVARRARA